MAVTYPKLHGPGNVVVKPGTLIDKETADGIVWQLTLTGAKDAFDSLGIARGTELGTLHPSFGVPAGYYIDEIAKKQLLFGANSDESAYEVDIVCRSSNNMGDGILGEEAIPEVFTVDWEVNMVALAQHSTRYPVAVMTSFVPDTSQTVYGFIKQWINAESSEVQASVVEQVRGAADEDQLMYFEDFIVMFIRGVLEREVFYPVLTRTKRVNTVTSANGTPGQIVDEDDLPTGFDGMKPPGDWTYRSMPTRIERIGRSGGYNIIDRWIGDPAWDDRLYGTLAEQAANYQSLG